MGIGRMGVQSPLFGERPCRFLGLEAGSKDTKTLAAILVAASVMIDNPEGVVLPVYPSLALGACERLVVVDDVAGARVVRGLRATASFHLGPFGSLVGLAGSRVLKLKLRNGVVVLRMKLCATALCTLDNFHFHVDNARCNHSEPGSGGTREVNDAAGSERSSVGNLYDNLLAVRLVAYAQHRAEGERLMRAGKAVFVVDGSAAGAASVKLIAVVGSLAVQGLCSSLSYSKCEYTQKNA